MAHNHPFLGIDFGTCRSSMAWFNPRTGQAEVLRNAEGEDQTPSVASFGKSGTLVGAPAERLLEDGELRQSVVLGVKRHLAREVVFALPGRESRPVEVVAAILGKLRCDAEQGHFREPVTRVVLTHPAAFDQLEQDRLRTAAQLAGFVEVELLPEPAAAALAYSHLGLKVGSQILVYDLGAGTFDLALLARAGAQAFRLTLEPRGLAHGGDDFDRALYDHYDQISQRQLGRHLGPDGAFDLGLLRACRRHKEDLSQREQCAVSLWLPSEQGPVLFKHTVDRTTFELLIRGDIEATVRLTQATLDEARAAGQEVDTVVLVGGSSRIPLVERLLKAVLPVEPLPWQQRDVAVALGAAWHGAALWPTRSSCPPDAAQAEDSTEVLEPLPPRPVGAGEFQEFLDVRDRLARVLLQLAGAFQGLGSEERSRHLLAVKKRLEANTFRLLVVGEFKRGKSTLINALLGRDVLPAKLAPCTAVVTEVKFAEEPRAVLHYTDPGRPPLTISVEDIGKHIVLGEADDEDEAGAAIRQSPFALLELYYPLPLCRNNVEIVDSPGLNEHQTRTRITVDYLTRADAVVQVLSCEQPLSRSELAFLKTQFAEPGLRHVFFLWNYFDGIVDDPEEVAALEKRSRELLEPRLGATPRVFYVSARSALVARKSGDSDGWQRSGLPAFETALEHFLATERGRIKLLTPLTAAERAMDEALTHLLPRREQLLAQPVEELQRRYEQQRPQLDELRRQRQRLLDIFDGRRDQLGAELNTACGRLLGELEDGLKAQVLKIDLTTWLAATSRNKAEELIGQRLQSWLDDKLGKWQRLVLTPLVTAQARQLQREIEGHLNEFGGRLETLREALAPAAKDHRAEARPDLPVWQQVLNAAGTLSLGEVRQHLPEGIDSKVLFQGAGLGLGLATLLALAHVAAPLVLGGLALGGLIGGLLGLRSKTSALRQQVTADAIAELRQSAQLTVTRLTDQLREQLEQLRTALATGTTILLDELAGQVEAVLEAQQQGETAVRPQRDRLTAVRQRVMSLARVTDSIRARLA